MTDLLAQCRAAPNLFPAVQEALGQVVGHKLFTLLAIDHDRGEMARIYSSHPMEYPVGGRKDLGKMTGWGQHVIADQKPWIGSTAADMEWAFFDHQIIAALGCASCLNVPVIDKGRVIGAVNLLHEAGYYAPDHIARVQPFADLLIPSFRDWAS
jgi:hypothetical protein